MGSSAQRQTFAASSSTTSNGVDSRPLGSVLARSSAASHKVTKSTPFGSIDEPLNPISLALGAEGTFVSRTIDSDRKHLTVVLSEAVRHRGTSFVEIYQNCPIFNDGAFDAVKDVDTRDEAIIGLEHGKPIRFGNSGCLGLIRNHETGSLEIVEVNEPNLSDVLIHDTYADDPTTAFASSRLTDYVNPSGTHRGNLSGTHFGHVRVPGRAFAGCERVGRNLCRFR